MKILVLFCVVDVFAIVMRISDFVFSERMRDSVAGSGGVGELEITPVSAAIARHLGIDLSSEGKAARNRRGLAIILHGAPLSGKIVCLSACQVISLPASSCRSVCACPLFVPLSNPCIVIDVKDTERVQGGYS